MNTREDPRASNGEVQAVSEVLWGRFVDPHHSRAHRSAAESRTRKPRARGGFLDVDRCGSASISTPEVPREVMYANSNPQRYRLCPLRRAPPREPCRVEVVVLDGAGKREV
jgi:hypothetical protein